jgi:predicted hotdog family 3-hydroxylacyl-ACP dehydratase
MQEEINIADVDVLTLLPQRPPFVMVDKLLSVNDTSARTEFTVRADSVFTHNNNFTEAGVIENIAQTCAAGMGYVHSRAHRCGVRIGFLSAVRNLGFKRLPKTGERLHTCVSFMECVMDMLLLKSVVTINDEVIAEGEMKIFITNIKNEKDR